MQSIARACGFVFFGLLAAAACSSSGPETDATNSEVSAACQQAQDDCKSSFDALAAEGAALETTCQNIRSACEAGPSAECTQAQDDCANATEQLKDHAASAIASCAADVNANCTSGSGGGSGSGSGSGGVSPACDMAITDCLEATQTVLQGASLPSCGVALLTACLDPNNTAGCEDAVAACKADAETLKTSADAVAAECEQEITANCP
jgi:hypothetical protein